MELFDKEYEFNGQSEAKKKKIYEEECSKIYKVLRITFLSLFIGIGFLFAILGIIFIIVFNDYESDEFIGGIIFLGLGLFFVVLGLILFFAIPKNANYERFKKRIQSGKFIMSSYDLAINVRMLSTEVEELEVKNKELEERIRRLEKEEKIRNFESKNRT